MNVGNTVDVPFHKGDWIKPRIGMVARVKADFQHAFVHLIQQPFQLWFEVDKARGMGVNTGGQAVFFGAHFRDCRDTIPKRVPFVCVHLFRLARTASGGCAAWRNAID